MRAIGVSFLSMSVAPHRTLLEPGHEAEWAELNREKDEYRRTSTRALTPSQRIQQGQKLSKQAVSLLAASIRAGHVSRRVLWS
jgi:mannose/cellobiose epimerase-like protein (N-acyl-D-glucosamine 2-epimerase family)